MRLPHTFSPFNFLLFTFYFLPSTLYLLPCILHRKTCQPLFRQLLVFRAGAAVVGVGMDADAATGCEQSQHLDVTRVHQLHEVLHNGVDAILVEIAIVTEGEQIEFQALALHHPFVGDVKNLDFGVVGLPGDGAERRKFGAVELHPVVVFGVAVLESFQHFRTVAVGILGAVSKPLQMFVFSIHSLVFFEEGFQAPPVVHKIGGKSTKKEDGFCHPLFSFSLR